MNPRLHSIATFNELKGRLIHLRLSVYEALLEHGPCTTRQLAETCHIDILTVRPRMTELVQLGFAECLDGEDREGVYKALTLAQAEALFALRHAEEQQGELGLA